MKKSGIPRHKRARLRFQFADDRTETVNLVDATAQSIMQFVRMTESDCAVLRAEGRKNIEMVAEFCVAGQFYLADQKPKASKPRGTIETDDRGEKLSVAAIVRKLISQYPEYGPADLWPHFLAELSQCGLNPLEYTDISPRRDKIPNVEYDAPTKTEPSRRKTTNLRTFGTTVSRAKKNP